MVKIYPKTALTVSLICALILSCLTTIFLCQNEFCSASTGIYLERNITVGCTYWFYWCCRNLGSRQVSNFFKASICQRKQLASDEGKYHIFVFLKQLCIANRSTVCTIQTCYERFQHCIHSCKSIQDVHKFRWYYAGKLIIPYTYSYLSFFDKPNKDSCSNILFCWD